MRMKLIWAPVVILISFAKKKRRKNKINSLARMYDYEFSFCRHQPDTLSDRLADIRKAAMLDIVARGWISYLRRRTSLRDVIDLKTPAWNNFPCGQWRVWQSKKGQVQMSLQESSFVVQRRYKREREREREIRKIKWTSQREKNRERERHWSDF